jgi:hypothetical protein
MSYEGSGKPWPAWPVGRSAGYFCGLADPIFNGHPQHLAAVRPLFRFELQA